VLEILHQGITKFRRNIRILKPGRQIMIQDLGFIERIDRRLAGGKDTAAIPAPPAHRHVERRFLRLANALERQLIFKTDKLTEEKNVVFQVKQVFVAKRLPHGIRIEERGVAEPDIEAFRAAQTPGLLDVARMRCRRFFLIGAKLSKNCQVIKRLENAEVFAIRYQVTLDIGVDQLFGYE